MQKLYDTHNINKMKETERKKADNANFKNINLQRKQRGQNDSQLWGIIAFFSLSEEKCIYLDLSLKF